jgi:hypothetical protein
MNYQTVLDDQEDQGEQSTFIDEEIPLETLLGGKKEHSRSRHSSNRRAPSPSIFRHCKSPIVLLLSLVISLIVIITLAMQTVTKPTMPARAKAPEVISDKRPRYAFGSLELYKLSAGRAQEPVWTKAGPDGSFVERRGSEIVMRNLEKTEETVLAASGAIKNVSLYID